MALKERKTALRQQVTAEVKKLEAAEIERQSTIVTKRVLELPLYQQARSLAIFLSMLGKEISTHDIVVNALDNGKSVFVPYIHPGEAPKSKVMDMLELRDRNDLESLQADAWGIPSLSKESIPERKNAVGGRGIADQSLVGQQGAPPLDLIFMPAVAFDRSRRRLGHGRGFYDRYLSQYKNHLEVHLSEQTMPALVGLALHQQILSLDQEIPVDEYDWLVDQVVAVGVD